MREKRAKNEFRVSWVVIILAFVLFHRLVLFWPIGLYLVFRKLGGQRSSRTFKTLSLIAGILACAYGADRIANGVWQFFRYGFNVTYFTTAWWGLIYVLMGLLMLLARRVIMDRDRRYDKYQAVIGSRYYMAIGDIASACGLPEKKVRRDLDRMIVRGYFGDTAFIEERGEYFLRSSYAYTILQKTRGESPESEPAKEEREPEATDEYQKLLREIRRANDRIVDGAISSQISRIEDITARIFKAVSDNPEKQPQIRSFLNYYLPTTLKLMKAYSDLERQGVSGENITAAKENIRDIMGRLVTGFERQLDELYKEDVLDISSDIQVLEHMMKKDGFMETGDMSPLAAEDTGAPEPDGGDAEEEAGQATGERE